MYQFYKSEELKALAQVYSEDAITPEYARTKIDSLTDGKSDLFEPVCLSLDMFNYMRAILPFNIGDSVMKAWTFDSQALNTSMIYNSGEMVPYDTLDIVNTSNKVDLIRV